MRERFGNRIALIGDIAARHERPIDTQDGAFYRYLLSHGIEPTVEAGLIANRYGLELSAKSIRRHEVQLDGP